MKVFHDHKIATAQVHFPDELLDQLYQEVNPCRTHRQMTVPDLKGRMIDRIRNTDDRMISGDGMKPTSVERKGDVLVAQATIGSAAIGSMGTKSLFR